MITFEELFNIVIEEKKQKKKVLSSYDYYKMIRKPTPSPGTAFKDKSKYSRKSKHGSDYTN